MSEAKIVLGVDNSQVATGLRKAQSDFERFRAGIEGEIGKATLAIGTFTAAVATAKIWVERNLEAVASFKQLSEQMGDTAEAVASLNMASAVSGVTMDSVTAASVKLTAALSKTDEEGATVAKAIQRLGLNFEEFKRLNPVDQLDAVSRAMAGFADGSGKTAVAVALFGKNGAQLIPFLNDLANGAERQVRLTEQQIETADRFSKMLARMRAESAANAQTLVVDFLPAIERFIQRGRDMEKAGEGILSFLAAPGLFLARAFGFVDPVNGFSKVRQELDLINGALQGKNLTEQQTNSLLEKRAELEKKLGTYLTSTAGAGRGTAPDPRSLGLPRLDGSGLNPDKAPGADPLAKAKAYLDSLEKQILSVSKLTDEEKALEEIRSGRLGKGAELPKALQSQIMDAAKRSDEARRREKEAEKAQKDAEMIDADLRREIDRQRAEELATFTKMTEEANKLRESLLSPAEKRNAEFERFNQLLTEGFIDWETYTAANVRSNEELAKTLDGLKKGKTFAEEFGLVFTSAFEDAMVAGKGFSDVLKGIERDIARIIIRKQITEPFGAAINAGISGLFGSSGGTSSGDFARMDRGQTVPEASSFLSSLFAGFRAGGGDVSAGRLYRVNEQGPEMLTVGGRDMLLMGNRPGSITPNHALGSGGGGGVTISIDARGADPQAAANLRATAGQIKDEVLAAVQQQARRSPAFRRSFGAA